MIESLEGLIEERIQAAKDQGNKELKLGGLGLTDLPQNIGDVEEFKFLDLSGNKFTEVPRVIGVFRGLERLELSFNPITTLPPEICELQNLEILSITELNLQCLPSEICLLKSLKILYAGLNEISRLPRDFSQLQALEGLFLHDNNFDTFPEEIRGCDELRCLTLGSKLTSIPSWIGAFRKMRRLCLVQNEISDVPAEIGAMEALTSLELADNNLTALPPEIGNLSRLSDISIRGNRLPPSLLSAERDGARVVLAQIRSLTDPKNVGVLREAKLMITGEGKVGKSCLRMALDGSLDPKKDMLHSTTWGVDCGVLELPDVEDPPKSILLNYWDFGGQKIYRITHQFFYSDQGLYLLVWDPRLGEEQCLIEDWLTRIATRTAGNAKVILVATHAKADGGNYNPYLDLSRLSPDLRALVVEQISVDSFTGFNIEFLRGRIAAHVRGMPGVKSPINRNWDMARQAALSAEDPAPWMSYRDFEKICSRHGIEDPEAVESIAATFLHRLGKGVWYGMEWPRDQFLKDTIVRDPSWLAMAFMEIVQHEPTKASGGILDHSRLSDVWIEHGREKDGWRTYKLDDHQRLMRMMRAQGVALPTKASNGERSLIPQLVPTEAPSLPWSDPNQLEGGKKILRMRSKIRPVVDGFMAQLIAALEPYHLYLEGERGAFWQSGIFLRDAAGRFENEALIEVKVERNFLEVNISATGEEPGFLLQQIDSAISECLKFWPGAERDDRVYCPRRYGANLCAGDFKLRSVERWLRNDTDSIICHECDENVLPSDLIFGLRGRVKKYLETDMLVHYLAFKEQRPAPRSVVIVPVEARWRDISNWEVLGRTRLKAQLRSEFSGVLVAEREFTANPGIFKYLGPAAKLGALFFAAVPLPLDLPGEVGEDLNGVSDVMDKLGGQLPEANGTDMMDENVSDVNLGVIEHFLKSVGLDPRVHGMDIERAPDGNWYWMSQEEVWQHRPLQAKLPKRSN